jgi:hypothetical protein
MSDSAIFFAGVIVTLIWSAAIGSLIWAAYLDGKAEKRRKQHAENHSHD